MADAPTIVWFRQDLRVSDHPALTAASKRDGAVVPVYILCDEPEGDWSIGGASRWWLHHSLVALSRKLEGLGSRLILRRGAAVDVLQALAKETGAARLHWTRGYAADAGKIDTAVKEAMDAADVTCKRFAGRLLFEPEEIKTGGGTPYKVFTPFWRACRGEISDVTPLGTPDELTAPKDWPESDALDDWGLLPHSPDWSDGFAPLWTPGEEGAQQKLKSFLDGPVSSYDTDRDRPDKEGTSRLSPHLHFGEISPRQVWVATQHTNAADGGDGDKFLAEIGWREFSHHLLFHWPTLPDEPFRPEFSAFPWAENKKALRAWQRGQTGYPIVDAGMRQLWQTGWMHNRVRMIVASFLIKHLLIHWREGEAWFWDTLVDADLASNAAGWQWVAGSGADASPYFRIFNPISQGQKFDPNGDYVREFVPELAGLPKSVIHEPWTADGATLAQAGVTLGETYPKPIVDHGEARKRALAGYDVVKEAHG
ncbi:MAG: deoxyribodipyrimidine photo-lyase [Pseudomonadota bacterium]